MIIVETKFCLHISSNSQKKTLQLIKLHVTFQEIWPLWIFFGMFHFPFCMNSSVQKEKLWKDLKKADVLRGGQIS